VGQGYDAHRFADGRKLILGGVEIEYPLGLDGHSDADALCHAVTDALLGAAALGDIGRSFPDSDPAYKNADSIRLLSVTAGELRAAGYETVNVDSTIIAQEPKLSPHINAMRQNLADALGIPYDSVSVKATTEEKMGFTGRLEGISAQAVALVIKK